MSRIEQIIIHCSDSPNGRDDRAEDILLWHTGPKSEGHRGWKHAGYHYVIELDGKVATLVPLDDDEFIEPWEIANGARGHNQNSIHICMIGTDKFTSAQWDALHHLTADLGLRYPDVTVQGHREFAPHKTCPGFAVTSWLLDPVRVQKNHLLEVTK